MVSRGSALPSLIDDPGDVSIGAAKRRVADLALLGGAPLFSGDLHVGRPNIGDRARLHELIDRALDRRRLTNDGPLVQEFESRVRDMTGARHAVAIVNATIGLQIAAKAADLDGEVIVPSFTFIATAHALDWIGLVPVFGDIDPERLTLDPAAIEGLIGPRTSAILATHLWGRTCDIDALAALADAHGIRVMYDAAHAFGCERDGRPVGTFGYAEVFSFHATKFVNAYEGCAITTDDEGIAERARLLRNFGFTGPDRTISTGTNGKMHEASAAMGLVSLDALDTFVAVNQRNDRLYRSHLADVDGLEVLAPDDRGRCNAQHVVLRVDRDVCAVERDVLYRVLRAENVRARRYFHPGCHRMAPYEGRPWTSPQPLPRTERLADETLVLPTGTGITPTQIEALCELIRFVVERGPGIRERVDLDTLRR
jgi:dTDP-4-amino-4,6-dideoxygalactose transaminase